MGNKINYHNSGMVGFSFNTFFPVPPVTWLSEGHKLRLLAGHLTVSSLRSCSTCATNLRYALYLVSRWLGVTTMTQCLLAWFCSSHYARLIFHSNGFDPDRYFAVLCLCHGNLSPENRSRSYLQCSYAAGLREIQGPLQKEGSATVFVIRSD
jgi:hypothetical protein